MTDDGKDRLEQAYRGLEQEAPDRVVRAIRCLRQPQSRPWRLPLGLLLVVSGFFGILPILGFEFIPIGLLLLAQDIPFLRKPVGDLMIWLEEKWVALRRWWQRR